MSKATDLAVVIPTHRRSEILARTLGALQDQTVQGFETIVVIDGVGEVPDAFADVSVLRQPHSGAAAARNLGVSATDRPLVLLLGDDMIPHPNLVQRHLDWHVRRPEERVAVLGHVDWHPEIRGNRILRWLDWSSTQFEYDRLKGMRGQDVGYGRFYSCNVSFKRALFDRVGGFDDDFIILYEDIDLGRRMHELGLELIYEPSARVDHLHDYDMASLARRFQNIALSERLMAAKHDWFEPFFLARVTRALDRPQAAPVWTWLADLAPPGQLRRWIRRRADDWYHQQLGRSFVDRWERAADVVDLWEYLGSAFQARLLMHHDEAVDEEAASSPDEETFYRTSTAYLYDLTAFAMSGTKDPYRAEVRRHVPAGARLLDYGCGIGADGLRLLAEGYDVHFADFDNPSTRYLRWRLGRHGRSAPVFDIDSDQIPPGYDAAYAFDVIEHVPDPFGLLARMEEVANLVVVNLLEEDEHDDGHARLHYELPIDEIVAHAEDRGLVSHTLHHGRSHLLVYRGA